MTTIWHEARLDVAADQAWHALRQTDRAHELFAGVLVDARMEGDVRTVTFANGLVVRERIVTVDDARRRIAYAVIGDLFEHHMASMQILAEGGTGCRFIWITD